jgi:hypothetical protein
MTAALAAGILESARFQRTIDVISVQSVGAELSALVPAVPPEPIDWGFALSCASALTLDESEAGQASALRVAQGCLMSSDAESHHREAAAVVLERLGNRPALTLAEAREMVRPDAWGEAPTPLRLDVVKRRLELAIPLAGGETLAGNAFQRQFWTYASATRWLSVSAPTSAGKSFIVKRWVEERMAGASVFRAAYLVPTRALIEEVANDLREHFGTGVGIHTIPWDAEIGSHRKEIHVVTQERFHLLHQRFPDLACDLLFIDEAQKFGDGGRGVLLERVLDDAIARNSAMQVLFASPLSQNPAMLLESSPDPVSTDAILAEMVTVNQNLLWADQIPQQPREWRLRLVSGDRALTVGRFTLQARPQPVSQRLPLVAVALGGMSQGNVVYVNRPSDAEKAAQQIFDALGPVADLSHEARIGNLRELVERTVHRDYALAGVLARGVAFHYGNMPLLLRSEIERLFRDGVLRYLVCTSTLLEGVNLPCRNLFVRGPKRGNGIVMTSPDFWNLAGRAGRWGKEFQGNIVCVDATDARLWPDPPTVRVRQPLKRATDEALREIAPLQKFIADGAPADRTRETPLLESMFSFLANRVLANQPLSILPASKLVPPDELVALEESIRIVVEGVDVPKTILQRHAGISPPAMQRLLTHFRAEADPTRLLVPTPESSDAVESYVGALARSKDFLGAKFGSSKRQWMLAFLIRDWMRGYPLARLIAGRLSREDGRPTPTRLAAIIRETMSDVEQFARFEAPKFMSCYLDVLALHLTESGHEPLASEMPDLNMMLELGVSRDTEVSLMTLGLSRTSVVAVSEFIIDDSLTREQCLAWLREQNLAALDLPAIVREELERVRARPDVVTD